MENEETMAVEASETIDTSAEEQSLEEELSQYLDEGSDEDSPEGEEIEYDGKTYKVPPELKDAFLRHSDYTKKTMSLAEERRAIEAAKAEVEQIRSISEGKLQVEVARNQAFARVEQLLATPIEGLLPEQVDSLKVELLLAQQQAAQIAGQADELSRKEQDALSQHFAKAREEAVKEAAKHIPNFTDQRRAELDSFVQKLGGKAGAVAELADPVAWQLVHFAEIGAKVLERQRQAAKVTAAQSVQPAVQVGGKSAATKKDLVKDADKMTPEEWLAQRNAQVRRK